MNIVGMADVMFSNASLFISRAAVVASCRTQGRDSKGAVTNQLMIGGDSRSDLRIQSALKFWLQPPLAPGALIHAATLTFSIQSSQSVTAPTPTAKIRVSAIASAWGPVTAADFAPTPEALLIGPAEFPNKIGYDSSITHPPLELDVTNAVKSVMAAKAGAVLFLIDYLSGGNASIWGTDAAIAANRPTLGITFTTGGPDPSGSY